MNRFFAVIFLVLLSAFANAEVKADLRAFSSSLKGFTADTRLKEEDFADLKAYGANVVRVSFSHLPLMKLAAPYAFNEEAFSVLDRYLALGKKYGIQIIIDPHVFPGMKGLYSMRPEDPFWENIDYQDKYFALWREIAKRYSASIYKSNIAGFDLLNEPAPPRGFGGDRCGALRELYINTINAIKPLYANAVFFIEFPMALNPLGRPTNQADGVQCLDPIKEESVIYSFHMYDPGQFTHQGVGEFKTPIRLYGGISDDKVKARLRERMISVIRYEQMHNVPIFVGEFGSSRFSGGDGVRYINILMDIFEEQKWGWVFHSFRESDVWNPELPVPENSEINSRGLVSSGKKKIDFIRDKLR